MGALADLERSNRATLEAFEREDISTEAYNADAAMNELTQNVASTTPTGAWTEQEINAGYLLCYGGLNEVNTPRTPSEMDKYLEISHELARRQAIAVRDTESDELDPVTFLRLMYATAEMFDYVAGAWIVHASQGNIDGLWQKICNETRNGDLGELARLYRGIARSGDASSPEYKVAVVCHDFKHDGDMGWVRRALDEICLSYGTCIAGFRPEFMNELGIYSTRTDVTNCHYTFAELGIYQVEKIEGVVSLQDDWIRDLHGEFKLCG